MNRTSLWLALALSLPLTAAVAATSSIARADAPPAAAAAEARPATTPVALDARFQRYLVSPRGQVTGMMLEGGTVVRVPPRAFTKNAPDLKAGDFVHVEGQSVKTGSETLVMRALVARGKDTVADARSMTKPEGHKRGEHKRGEHKAGEKREKGEKTPLAEVTSTGKIVAIVTGPKGRVADLVLDDGTTATAGWKSKLGELGLKVGDQVTLSGRGGTYAKGKGMMIKEIKLPSGQTKTLEQGHRGGHKGQPV